MMLSRRIGGCAALAAFVWLAAAPAVDAGPFGNVGRILQITGFDVAGNNNPLSGGASFSVTNDFPGNTLDFGDFDLTLDGPVTFGLATGGRIRNTLDVQLNIGTPGTPLNYALALDTGARRTTYAGSAILDAGGQVDAFGFYDMNFTFSNRTDVISDGRFGDDFQELDFDIGPVNVSGNLFADMLAGATEPLFAATNSQNIFANFSGRSQREAELSASVVEARAKVMAGGELTKHELSELISAATVAGIMGDVVPDLGFIDGPLQGSGRGVGVDSGALRTTVAPEPGTLLLLGVPLLLLRRRR